MNLIPPNIAPSQNLLPKFPLRINDQEIIKKTYERRVYEPVDEESSPSNITSQPNKNRIKSPNNILG